MALSSYHGCDRHRHCTDTVTPMAGHEETHPHPTLGVYGASYGPDPPSPCCDPSGDPGRATVPLHLSGLSKAGDEQGLSRADLLSRIHPLQQLCQCSRLGFSKNPRQQECTWHSLSGVSKLSFLICDPICHSPTLFYHYTLFYHHTVFYHLPSFKDEHPSPPRKPLHESLGFQVQI